MNYFISRAGKEYGPYSLGDLQRYVASGEILVTDMARSEGMNELMPISQIIGTIPVPAAQIYTGHTANPSVCPDPPNLHWGLVLLFGVITCGLFMIVWDFVQAAWMKKVAPKSRAIYYYIVAAAMVGLIYISTFALALNHSQNPYAALLNLAYIVFLLIGRFSLRSSLEEHFNSVEPMGLSLSGVMTFFFGAIYFQYHINDIVRRKNAVLVGAI